MLNLCLLYINSFSSGYPGNSSHYESNSGQLYLTNKRLAYLSTITSAIFQSFLLPFDQIEKINKDFSMPWVGSEIVRIEFQPVIQCFLNVLFYFSFRALIKESLERLEQLFLISKVLIALLFTEL